MNGAESLVKTLLAAGVDTCFANPGTSEMHFVAALDRIAGMRCILGVAEGTVTAAADGYARMAGKPAATLLHCGPGLANGLVNLHNAQKAHVPIVNIVGDQATYHKGLNPPLAAATEEWARPVSVWTRTTMAAPMVGADAADAVLAACTSPGGIATLILPSDSSWSDGGVVAAPHAVPPAPHADASAIANAARVLRSGEPTLILLGGAALRAGPTAHAAAIAAATGATVMAEVFNTRHERGRGRHPVNRIPFAVDMALAALAPFRHLILVNAEAPVAFFAYPGKPGHLFPAAGTIHALAVGGEDGAAALAALADELGARPVPAPEHPRPEPAQGAVTPEAFARTLSALLPDNAIVADESITFGFALSPFTQSAPPHDWLQLTGGAIGIGPPLATGAAVGAPGRRVVNIQADGSALYNLQALWTQAREKLAVTTIILSNRRYAILDGELANVGAGAPGKTARDLFDLGNPDLDWVRLANGFGVEGAKADTMEKLADLMTFANRRAGPFLIELAIG
jgi:acetolactate synthase-1/2/3 large subunit